jgi:hypothetical protein
MRLAICYRMLQPRLEMNLVYAAADREQFSRLLTRHKLVELLFTQQQQRNVHPPLTFRALVSKAAAKSKSK